MIKQAAYKCIKKGDNFGRIFVGKQHGDVIRVIDNELHIVVLMSEWLAGFVTDDGKFLNRREAYFEAVKCGQIENDGDDQVLISEDLY